MRVAGPRRSAPPTTIDTTDRRRRPGVLPELLQSIFHTAGSMIAFHHTNARESHATRDLFSTLRRHETTKKPKALAARRGDSFFPAPWLHRLGRPAGACGDDGGRARPSPQVDR